MWELKEPEPVKLIIGILAADKDCLNVAAEALTVEFGKADFVTKAPDGKEVEELTQKEILKCLKNQMPLKQFSLKSSVSMLHPACACYI